MRQYAVGSLDGDDRCRFRTRSELNLSDGGTLPDLRVSAPQTALERQTAGQCSGPLHQNIPIRAEIANQLKAGRVQKIQVLSSEADLNQRGCGTNSQLGRILGEPRDDGDQGHDRKKRRNAHRAGREWWHDSKILRPLSHVNGIVRICRGNGYSASTLAHYAASAAWW